MFAISIQRHINSKIASKVKKEVNQIIKMELFNISNKYIYLLSHRNILFLTVHWSIFCLVVSPWLTKMFCWEGGKAQGARQQAGRFHGSYLTLKSSVSHISTKGPWGLPSIHSLYIELYCLGEWRDITLFHLTVCCCTRATLESHSVFFPDLLVQDKTDTYKLIAITSLFHKNAPCYCPDYVSNNFNRKSSSITWKAKRILKLCEHI